MGARDARKTSGSPTRGLTTDDITLGGGACVQIGRFRKSFRRVQYYMLAVEARTLGLLEPADRCTGDTAGFSHAIRVLLYGYITVNGTFARY